MGFGSKPQIEFKLFGHIYLNTPKMNWIRNQKSEQKGDIFHMWPHKIYRRKSVKQTLEREKKKKTCGNYKSTLHMYTDMLYPHTVHWSLHTNNACHVPLYIGMRLYNVLKILIASPNTN